MFHPHAARIGSEVAPASRPPAAVNARRKRPPTAPGSSATARGLRARRRFPAGTAEDDPNIFDEHLREQARRRDPLVDDVRRHRLLDQPLAAAADPLVTDMLLDRKHAWRIVEFFAHILTETLQAATAAAMRLAGFMSNDAPRERSGQRNATRLFFECRDARQLQRLDPERDCLDIRIDGFIQKRALHDIELLAVPTEAIAFQSRHLMRQLIDLPLLVFELIVAPCNDGGLRAEYSVLLTDLRIAFSKLREEGRGQITQLICVHLNELARGLHGLKCCHILGDFNRLRSAFFSQYSNLCALIEPLP